MTTEKLTDWEGNEIKAGDTVLIISTKIPKVTRQYGIIDFGDPKSKFIPICDINDPEPPTYIKSGECKVFEQDGVLLITQKIGDIDITSAVGSLNFLSSPGQILCIKGVSDNPTKYMLLNP